MSKSKKEKREDLQFKVFVIFLILISLISILDALRLIESKIISWSYQAVFISTFLYFFVYESFLNNKE